MRFRYKHDFFYDETNNVKKFQFKNGNLNVTEEKSFVLGGIAYESVRPDLTGMFDGLNLMANASEVKFRHVCRHGELLDCLKSSLLTPFLKFILSKDIYMHYSSLNVLYYALADIIDSALEDYPLANRISTQYPFFLKDAIYRIAVLEKDAIMPLLFNYEYPSIPDGKASDFVNELLAIVDKYSDHNELHLPVQFLKDLLKYASGKSELVFLTDEKKHVMINGFVELYKRPVYLFVNSMHHFDHEADIELEIDKYSYTYEGEVLNNFDLSDSKADQLTQASDVIVGLLGKISNFVNDHTIQEIEDNLENLSVVQLENLELLRSLAEKSHDKNMAFVHYVESLENIEKWRRVLFPQ